MTISAPDPAEDLPGGQPAPGSERELRAAGKLEQSDNPDIRSDGVTTGPTKVFIRSRLAYFIAFGGGAGLSRTAPGTVGTLTAFPLFWILDYFFDPLSLLALVAGMFFVGVWACDVTGRALGDHDHGGMVWDEITAFLLVLFFTPPVIMWQAFAFLLFRLFDIIKPPPIGYYDRKLRGGFGVMFDDLLAAFLTLLCLAGWKALGIESLI